MKSLTAIETPDKVEDGLKDLAPSFSIADKWICEFKYVNECLLQLHVVMDAQNLIEITEKVYALFFQNRPFKDTWSIRNCKHLRQRGNVHIE